MPMHPSCDFLAPEHKFQLHDLLKVKAPPTPNDFESFWQEAYQTVLIRRPRLRLAGERGQGPWRVFDMHYQSTDGVTIGGWLLLPKLAPPRRGFIIGHGYGGRDAPDLDLPFHDAALLFPCFRGISRSRTEGISDDPYWHVLHHIDDPKRYVLRGCVEDLWLGVSALLSHFPQLEGKLGYLGISFGGGIGALALACEKRIASAHFNVPTFGQRRLRLRLPTHGSGRAVQSHCRAHSRTVLKTLSYFDAACAAPRLTMPIHCALALQDPVVTPPGQFAIYNMAPSDKQLFVLDAGHMEYPRQEAQRRELVAELEQFFAPLVGEAEAL